MRRVEFQPLRCVRWSQKDYEEIGETQTLKFCSTFSAALRRASVCDVCVPKTSIKGGARHSHEFTVKKKAMWMMLQPRLFTLGHFLLSNCWYGQHSIRCWQRRRSAKFGQRMSRARLQKYSPLIYDCSIPVDITRQLFNFITDCVLLYYELDTLKTKKMCAPFMRCHHRTKQSN